MLQKAIKDLRGDAIVARDGAIGSVDDVYFDDERWIVRYLVVDTGAWLPGRKVLISPACVMPIHGRAELRVALTREQIEQSPGVDRDPPISRSLEAAHARYFGYPYYWSGPYLWGTAGMPVATEWSEPAAVRAKRANETGGAEPAAAAEQRAAESHVRSVREVVGYQLHATDGDLGRVEDFIVDDETWAIADLLVDPRGWLPGKKVLVAPGAVADVDWANREVRIRLIRDEVERTPAYR